MKVQLNKNIKKMCNNLILLNIFQIYLINLNL